MPTYEYLCQTCSHRFETWQKMTDEPLTVCPECGSRIRRVLYPAGIVFKGSGFYKTDHGNGAVAPATNTESEAKKTESTTTETSSTTKTTESGSSSTASTTSSESAAGAK